MWGVAPWGAVPWGGLPQKKQVTPAAAAQQVGGANFSNTGLPNPEITWKPRSIEQMLRDESSWDDKTLREILRPPKAVRRRGKKRPPDPWQPLERVEPFVPFVSWATPEPAQTVVVIPPPPAAKPKPKPPKPKPPKPKPKRPKRRPLVPPTDPLILMAIREREDEEELFHLLIELGWL